MAITNNPLLLPGAVYELRAPRGRQGTISGYFDNPADLYTAAQDYDGKVAGLYFTLNPVNPALLARAKNRLASYAKTTTSDADIQKREWILIDCDAVRPADISSTCVEHDAALDRTLSIMTWLSSQGWPEPVRADSGNGAHLLYRVELPNDAAGKELVKAVLEVLALRFNDSVVTVDTSVFNAARITKLYGTMVCKGDSTDDRPHRRSQVLYVPDSILPVTFEQLTDLARLRPVDPKPGRSSWNGGPFNLGDFMQRHGLNVAREKSWCGGTVYELEQCPFNPEHARSSSLIQFPTGGLAFRCFHNSCQSYHWQELRTHLEPDRERRSFARPAVSEQADSSGTEFTLISADTIRMKSVTWVIQGRIPLGMLTVLAGRGGLGKSTLGCEWAAQITNGKAAGVLAGSPSPVIVCSTEDAKAETLVPRLTAAHADLSKVHFLQLHRGGIDGSLTIPDDIDVLRQAVQQTGSKLIIIDPLMAHLSATLNSWNDQEIRRALTPLAKLAEELAVVVLVLAHLNKDSKKEAIDRIGGSVGISNTARSVLFVGTAPDDPDGKIKMLAHPKCNVGPEQPTLRYRTETVFLQNGAEFIETTKIVWEGEAPGITADDLVAKADPISREDREHAVDWLAKALPVGVRRKQSDIESDASKQGIKTWSLRKAKTLLAVKSRKEGFTQGGWVWWRDEDAYNTPSLTSSSKTPSNLLKSSKVREDASAHAFDTSSTPEDARKAQPLIFDASSNISTTYMTSALEGVSAGSYIEEVDLRDP